MQGIKEAEMFTMVWKTREIKLCWKNGNTNKNVVIVGVWAYPKNKKIKGFEGGGKGGGGGGWVGQVRT